MSSPRVQVFRSAAEARGRFGPCALAIGNFDGVHIGHRALIAAAVRFAKQADLVPAALTFHPHPTAVVAPTRVPPMICTLEERVRFLAAAGARHILVLPFTPELSRLTPREFVSQILVNELDTKAVFVGENFRFGYKHSGDTAALAALGKEFEFVSQFIEPVRWRNEIVSSSAIRRYLSEGNVVRAGRLLGRCFSVTGPVVSGHGVGSKQTVPTLNLRPAPDQLLPRGVFVTETLDQSSDRRWPSITNVGTRPTFSGDELTIETFLLAPLDEPSPGQIEVRFHHWVRPERKFPDPDSLKTQILKDVGRARAYWRRRSRFGA